MKLAALAFDAQDICSPYESCIPLIRWGDVTGPLASRSDSFLAGVVGTITGIPAQIAGSLLSFGNGLYKSAAELVMVSSGTKTSLTASLGPAMNTFVGNIYSGITGSWALFGVIFMVAAIAGMVAVFRGAGTRALLQRLGAFILGIALCISMGAMSVDHPNSPAPGTPYWVATTVAKLTSELGNEVTSGITQTLENTSATNTLAKSNTHDALSCQRYISQKNGLMHFAEESAKANGKTIDATVRMLNLMWEESGLRTWGNIQFGNTSFMPILFCRPLEAAAKIEGIKMAAIASSNLEGTPIQTGDSTVTTLNGLAPAFNPSALVANKPGQQWHETSMDTTKSIDRYTTMWMACKIPQKDGTITGTWNWRYGMQFLNRVEGTDKDGISSNPSAQSVCSAAFTGSNAEHPEGFLISTTKEDNEDDKAACEAKNKKSEMQKYVAACAKIVEADNDTLIRALNSKFNLPEEINVTLKGISDGTEAKNSNWKYMITANNTLNQNKNAETLAAITALHGGYQFADLFAAFMFVLAGLVNFVIWGLLLSFIRIFGTIAGFLIAGPGLMGGFLIYALAPERGKKALKNSAIQLVAMCAVDSIVSLISAIVATVTMALMNAISATMGDNISTTMVALEAIICPLGSLALLRYLCVSVWKVGDPMSMTGLTAIASGKAVMGKFGKALGGVAAGAAGGAAALAMGGGIAAAARSVVNGAAGGSIAGAATRGMNAGFAENLEKKKLAALEGRGGKTSSTPTDNQAERAAGEVNSQPTAKSETTSQPAVEPKNTNSQSEQEPTEKPVVDQATDAIHNWLEDKSGHYERVEKAKHGDGKKFSTLRALGVKDTVKEAGYIAKRGLAFAVRHKKAVKRAAIIGSTVALGPMGGIGMAALLGGGKLGVKGFMAAGRGVERGFRAVGNTKKKLTAQAGAEILKPLTENAFYEMWHQPRQYRKEQENKHKETIADFLRANNVNNG